MSDHPFARFSIDAVANASREAAAARSVRHTSKGRVLIGNGNGDAPSKSDLMFIATEAVIAYTEALFAKDVKEKNRRRLTTLAQGGTDKWNIDSTVGLLGLTDRDILGDIPTAKNTDNPLLGEDGAASLFDLIEAFFEAGQKFGQTLRDLGKDLEAEDISSNIARFSIRPGSTSRDILDRKDPNRSLIVAWFSGMKGLIEGALIDGELLDKPREIVLSNLVDELTGGPASDVLFYVDSKVGSKFQTLFRKQLKSTRFPDSMSGIADVIRAGWATFGYQAGHYVRTRDDVSKEAFREAAEKMDRDFSTLIVWAEKRGGASTSTT